MSNKNHYFFQFVKKKRVYLVYKLFVIIVDENRGERIIEKLTNYIQ